MIIEHVHLNIKLGQSDAFERAFQKAKEIIAKLQNKVGKFGLIRDQGLVPGVKTPAPDWTEEALAVLLQLQYKRVEAQEMIVKALQRSSDISSVEELLNEIYKQRMNG